MKTLARVRIFMIALSFGVSLPVAFADFEQQALGAAINTLDHYLQAGASDDARRGAVLLQAFDTNARRAEYDTQRLYRKQRNLFASYVSVSSELYGYEVQKVFGRTRVELEGGIETREGVTAEFKARVVYRNKQWRIATLEID